MTTINDISDLVQVLQDRPDWLVAVRNLVLSEGVIDLPQQLARFVGATEENFRLVHQQLGRLEGRAGNFDGYVYERRVRSRVLFRLRQHFGMNSPSIVMHQEGLVAPEIHRIFDRATQFGAVRQDEVADLQETDMIITDQDGSGHVVVEVSITADNDDILRAERRARVMGLASGTPTNGVVATANLHGPQQALANDRGVTALLLPNR